MVLIYTFFPVFQLEDIRSSGSCDEQQKQAVALLCRDASKCLPDIDCMEYRPDVSSFPAAPYFYAYF